MKHSVMCIVETRGQADAIVERLQNAGFSTDVISALLPDTEGSHDFAHTRSTKGPEGAVAGASAGALPVAPWGCSPGWARSPFPV